MEASKLAPIEDINFYRNIILRPVITEKSMAEADQLNKYHFHVHPDANKVQIRRAIEALFDVRVTAVNTMNTKGKTRQRSFRHRVGQTAAAKKAIVTLAPGDRIELIESV